ncbi:hypothetical protein OHB41_47595 [Streptomyces sp. NBC_01571]|nr:hypothetical protein [Streptomyces sp. NBC_01571]MCX4580660.1 hypothetical protein [Streptomyces sp. NBC_01571]
MPYGQAAERRFALVTDQGGPTGEQTNAFALRREADASVLLGR